MKKWKSKPRLGPRLQNTHSGVADRYDRRLTSAFKLVDAAVTVWEHKQAAKIDALVRNI